MVAIRGQVDKFMNTIRLLPATWAKRCGMPGTSSKAEGRRRGMRSRPYLLTSDCLEMPFLSSVPEFGSQTNTHCPGALCSKHRKRAKVSAGIREGTDGCQQIRGSCSPASVSTIRRAPSAVRNTTRPG